jgi:hypothetical protein
MSTIKANTLLHSDGTTTTQPSIPALDKRMAKAWVNFNGEGTVAINSAYNVSSITDNAQADYTVNFTNSMANANYSFSLGVEHYNTSAQYSSQHIQARYGGVVASSLRMIITRNQTGTQYDGLDVDSANVCAQVFGN